MLDGVLESKTAYMHQPYCHSGEIYISVTKVEERGRKFYELDELKESVKMFDKLGFQVLSMIVHNLGRSTVTQLGTMLSLMLWTQ